MSTNFPDGFPREAIEIMHDHLRPGENIVFGMTVTVEELDGTTRPGTFAITDQRLYAFGFKRPLLGGQLKLVAVDSVPLARLSSISFVEDQKWYSKRLHIELRFKNGGYEHLITEDLSNGGRFLSCLRDRHDRADLARAASSSSIADELSKLGQLKGQGLLSDDDWERAKELFLGKRPDERESAIENLRQLHGLYRAGVLSESEFNSKKWDVLSRH